MPHTSPHPGLTFVDVRVFDGIDMIGPTKVEVRDGRIVTVGPRGGCGDPDVEVVDGRGRTLLPGLIDAHVHATEMALERAPVFGVTTQLDMFADEPRLAVLRARAASRTDVADLRSSGIGATAPGAHPCQMVAAGLFPPFPQVEGVGAAERFVADRVAAGADYIKIFVSGVPGEPSLPVLDRAVVTALVDAAHRHGRLALAHALGREAALVALRAGVDGLVHLPFDAPPDGELVAATVRARAFVTPTLTMIESFCQVPGGATVVDDPWLGRLLSPDATADLRRVMSPPPPSGSPHRAHHAHAAVPLLRDAGVPLLAGTDALAPGTAHGASLHRELELLVRAGLTPVEALRAATSVPAACFGLGDRGAVRPGLRADLLLVDGDPSTDITHTRRIVAVYRGGVALDRARPATVAAAAV